MYHDLSCQLIEVARHASEFLCSGCIVPSSDFLVCSGPFIHLSFQSFSFFVLSVCLYVGDGDGREAGQKCYFSEYLGGVVGTAISLECSCTH